MCFGPNPRLVASQRARRQRWSGERLAFVTEAAVVPLTLPVEPTYKRTAGAAGDVGDERLMAGLSALRGDPRLFKPRRPGGADFAVTDRYTRMVSLFL